MTPKLNDGFGTDERFCSRSGFGDSPTAISFMVHSSRFYPAKRAIKFLGAGYQHKTLVTTHTFLLYTNTRPSIRGFLSKHTNTRRLTVSQASSNNIACENSEKQKATRLVKTPIAPPFFIRTMKRDSNGFLQPDHSATQNNSAESIDEYANTVQDLYKSNIILSVRTGWLCSISNAFTGKALVDWLLSTSRATKHKDAVDVGQALLERIFFVVASPSADLHAKLPLFRDAVDAVYQLPLGTPDNTVDNGVLNADKLCISKQREASETAKDLRKMILSLYGQFVSEGGKSVDYNAMSASTEFVSYERLSEQLQRANIDTLSRDERLAFFLNIYNALVIHWRITKGPARGMQAFRIAAYLIGGRRYTLNDIEHGILRGNTRPPYHPFRQISPQDPRAAFVFDQPDARIHFALNCGAKSCPPIRAYRAEKIDSQLRMATEAFLGSDDGVTVNEAENSVVLSKLFSWYAHDFDGGNVLQWIYEHLPQHDEAGALVQKKAALGRLLESGNSGKIKIKYFDYDWEHNSIS